MARVTVMVTRSPLLAVLAVAVIVTAALLFTNRKPSPLAICTKETPLDVVDRLNTMWIRSGPIQGFTHTAVPLQRHLGTVDRIDVYHNVSNAAGKSTVIFAYRRSTCADWNRHNPDKLFADSIFNSLPEGGVNVDVGACYGDTSVPLAVRADMVISLEPNPSSFRVLELNALLNPGLNIRPHNVAAGDGKVSELTFTYGGDMCNGGIIGDWKNASLETTIRVQAVDLPSFLLGTYGQDTLRRIQVIKVDAEGFDSSIIGTLKPLLKYSKFILLTEWFDYYVTSPPHGNGGPEDVHPGAKALFDAIEELGYAPFNPYTGARIPGPQNKHKVPDLLCKPTS